MERFLKKWIFWLAFAAGSVSFQNWCPATVVGSSDAASTVLEIRGARPVASAPAAATCADRVDAAPGSRCPRGSSAGEPPSPASAGSGR